MRYSLLITIIALSSQILSGQIAAPGASTNIRLTSYSPKDQIFFYCNSTGTEKGSLSAQRPRGTGTYDFVWYKWNDGTNSFSTLIKTDPGTVISTITGLDKGGYRVRIENGGLPDTTMSAWIFFDTPPLSQSGVMQQLCDRLALDGRAEATTASFAYKNTVTGAPLSLNNEVTFLWSGTPSTYIPAPSFFIDPIIVNTPPPNKQYRLPMEDVTFKLAVNSLGCSSESSFLYETIHVKSAFKADPVEGEAPLEVVITDESVRADNYTWDFGDDTVSSWKDPMPHTYYKPGDYYIKLFIESNLHCTDMADSVKITVVPSDLDIPNVFTPDDDGYNDRFRVFSKSLRFISMEVFSQSGIKVYGFSGQGESLKNWEGWDGKVNNSSADARPGVYFYIIRAIGWDDIKYDSKEYRGFVYLYR